jgi:hypothetical protein
LKNSFPSDSKQIVSAFTIKNDPLSAAILQDPTATTPCDIVGDRFPQIFSTKTDSKIVRANHAVRNYKRKLASGPPNCPASAMSSLLLAPVQRATGTIIQTAFGLHFRLAPFASKATRANAM